MSAIPKPKREIDTPYRQWIKTLPCYAGMRMEPLKMCMGIIDPHHVIPDGGGKTGSKVSDRRCIPLCRFHHDEAERSQRVFNATYGDPEGEIRDLNREYDARTRGPRKPKPPRQVKQRLHLSVTHCQQCGDSHNLPLSKVSLTKKTIHFTCPRSLRRVS